jgi:hypothetical protein
MRLALALIAMAVVLWIVPVVLAFTVGRLLPDRAVAQSFMVVGELLAGAVAGSWTFLAIYRSVA